MAKGRYPEELRQRALRLVQEHRDEYGSEWQAMKSIAAKLGIHADTLRGWRRQQQVDVGQRQGLSTEDRERLKQLEKENRELRRANEILKSASAFFAAEFDGRHGR